MKSTLKIMFLILTIVATFVTVQNVSAVETTDVTGTIESISYKPNMVVVDGTEIFGIKFNYLCNQYNICLEQDYPDQVTISYYEFLCQDGTIKNMASTITVDDATIELRVTD